jgi:hypothetical protein
MTHEHEMTAATALSGQPFEALRSLWVKMIDLDALWMPLSTQSRS